jgi:hypothetical protein
MSDHRTDHLEECPACGGHMVPGSYICNACKRDAGNGSTPKLVMKTPEYLITEYLRARPGRSDICSSCPMEARCRERVSLGLWVLCEIPDELDIITTNTMGDKDQFLCPRLRFSLSPLLSSKLPSERSASQS